MSSHLFFVSTYLCLWWTFCVQIKASNHILKAGETLNGTDELCSEKGTYCLNFNRVIEKSNYLQIISKETDWIVWIADRDQPVDPDSAVLVLDQSGVLKIESKNIEPIILYSSPHPSNNTVATLMDTGNFELQQLHPDGSNTVLWQSFDYPTDSLIPQRKLGVNFKTGRHWSLVSWLAKENPKAGAFSLEWEPTRRKLVIKKRGQLCWESEELRSNDGFMHNTPYRIVSNENESYFTITSSNKEITRWALLENGQLINHDRGDIGNADMCYGYNTDGGCIKWEEKPSCRHRGDAFVLKVGYPDEKFSSILRNSSYGHSDCEAICWRNCSCVAFSKYNNDGTGCTFFHWNSMLGDNIASAGSKFYMLENTRHKSRRNWVWISIATPLFIICFTILRLTMKKRKYKFEGRSEKEMEIEILDLTTSNKYLDIEDLEGDLKKEHDLKVFNYTTILAATNDFSSENKLGQGGFGPVYKGVLPTMQEVAVKRLSKSSGQGMVEFKNELTLISELQHTNLVQLLGCCIHKEERILIYEYMSNKSLDFYLFDQTRGKLLDWKMRFKIVEGIAQGLLYLHKYSRLTIIHRDLKAGNILLDENMNPKISDFGMARMFKQQDSINTNKVVGTYGYMSPEYAMEGVFSVKSDVYSFGVLLLEIVSGRRNNSFYDNDRPLNLIGHAWELWIERAWQQLIDSALGDSYVLDEVERCIHVGLLCVEQYPNDRPTMSDIVSMLTNKNATLTLPQRPAFYTGREILDEKFSTKEFLTDSTKAITTSTKAFTTSREIEEM